MNTRHDTDWPLIVLYAIVFAALVIAAVVAHHHVSAGVGG